MDLRLGGLQFVLGLVLALLLNREFPGRRLVQALVFLPWAVPTFLVGLDWEWLFNPVVGPLPALAARTASDSRCQQSAVRPAPCTDRPDRRSRLVGHTLLRDHAAWRHCSPSRRICTKPRPSMAPVCSSSSARSRCRCSPRRIAISILLRTIWVANFADLIIVMTNGGPADSTQTVASYIFTAAFRRLDFGYASAIATVLLLLLLAVCTR